MVIYNVTHAHVIRKARKFSPPIKVCYFSIYQDRIKKHNTKHPLSKYIYLHLFQRIVFPVDELRIEVDCLASKGYVEIDAIEIVGGILQCTLNYPFLHTSSFQATYLCISRSLALDAPTFSFRYVPFALFQIQKLLLLYKERRCLRGWSLCE